MAATEAPERIGPYRLLRRLGEGGMGVVHLGLDSDDRQVAVKVLHPHVASDLKARDRLTREVETMRRVRNNRVAAVLDADLTGATPYIVTRFAPGRTLEQRVLEDGPLKGAELTKLARGLCEALVAIHHADVIHRDLKPANVMLVDDGSGMFEPLVIDFGIAHLVNATRLTQTGMFVGTPGYLAPEIIRDSEITQAADVHALAATVFFAATGKPPFGSGTFESVCYNILEGKAQVDTAPAFLRGWLRLALATDSQSRPTAGSLLKLSRALDPSVTVFKEGGTAVQRNQSADGTRVLSDGTRVLADGTRVLNDGTRVLTDGTRVLGDGTRVQIDGTRVLDDVPSARRSETYSDLLPPVNYVAPEREPRPQKPSKQRRSGGSQQPPPYVPPYQPAPQFAPPPYADQRVAGHPAPQQMRPAPVAPPQARPPAYQPPPQPQQDRPRYKTSHPVMAGLMLAVLVGAACLLPVMVSLFAIVLVLCLRVGNSLLGDVSERRSIRGASGSDPMRAVLGTPWALLKAVLATLVHVPLGILFGICVWGAFRYLGGMTTNDAAAYAAAAFVGGLFLLPGGRKPRQAVQRALAGVIRSPGAGMVITLVFGTLAFFIVMTALSAEAVWTPWRPPSAVIDDLVASLGKGQDTAVNLITGLFEDLMSQIGLGFLVGK
ncbi:serine/threonine-protein kinase [Herbidospora mongoliensis]|uniref:serine/threonine-protein kinase n=1 Tax=Herbidospora mongoliensis TaxID=688067 RepID=UPI0008325BD2|nr:serine/threonine-protein kinase [Herbidospora mongoliensis]